MIRRSQASQRAFTLVEVLMSIAIMAGLAVATASAIGATTRAFRANLASTETLQHARTAMIRMAAELRSGTNHLPLTASKQLSFAAGTTVSDSGVSFYDELGRKIVYKYDVATGTLTLKIDTGATAVLARGVDAFVVRLVPLRSRESIKTGGIYDELERATLTLTLHPVDKMSDTANSLTLTQSVTPRSRLWG